jgi:hypothetical protein
LYETVSERAKVDRDNELDENEHEEDHGSRTLHIRLGAKKHPQKYGTLDEYRHQDQHSYIL